MGGLGSYTKKKLAHALASDRLYDSDNEIIILKLKSGQWQISRTRKRTHTQV